MIFLGLHDGDDRLDRAKRLAAHVGSANCDRRGYSHDSQAVAGIGGADPAGVNFAYKSRVQIWLARLNPGGGRTPKIKAADIEDWRDGLTLMQSPD